MVLISLRLLDLEPVIYGYELTNRTEASLIFNVTPQGDFDHFQLNCMTTMHEAPCINLSREYDKCVKALNIEGVYGCNYQCSFITKKESYIDFYSRNYPINICKIFKDFSSEIFRILIYSLSTKKTDFNVY